MQQIKITQSVTTRTQSVENYLRDISSIPLISIEKETALASRIQNGDEEALDELVAANLRFVVSVAKQYQGSGVELCDLINEGNIGLMKAALRFDPTRGFKFISYAVWWIRQQIMSAISEQGRMVRLPVNQASMINRINKAKSDFLQKNEREPSDSELAEFLDIAPEQIDGLMEHTSKTLSYDLSFGEESDGTLLDILEDPDSRKPDEGLQHESLSEDLNTAMLALSPREKEIICMSFGIGRHEMTLDEIAMHFNLTRERVRQVREHAIRKLGCPSVMKLLRKYM